MCPAPCSAAHCSSSLSSFIQLQVRAQLMVRGCQRLMNLRAGKKTPNQALELPSIGNRVRVHILPAHIPELKCRWKSGHQATPDLQEHRVLAPETEEVMEIHFLPLRVRALGTAEG